jgi:hypothetical protein
MGNVEVGDFRSGDTRTGDININFPTPVIPPQETHAPPTGKINSLPLLEFVESKEIFLHFNHAHAEEVPYGTHIGLIAIFKNPPAALHGKNVAATDVTAHLKYENRAGKTADYTCAWVGHAYQGIDINHGDAQKLIVVFRDKPSEKLSALITKNEHPPITYTAMARLRAFQSLRGPIVKEIMQDCSEIGIALIGNEGHTLFDGHFTLEVMNGGKMHLARKSG